MHFKGTRSSLENQTIFRSQRMFVLAPSWNRKYLRDAWMAEKKSWFEAKFKAARAQLINVTSSTLFVLAHQLLICIYRYLFSCSARVVLRSSNWKIVSPTPPAHTEAWPARRQILLVAHVVFLLHKSDLKTKYICVKLCSRVGGWEVG